MKLKQKVTPRLFSAFKGAYPGLLPGLVPEPNFKISRANYILNTPSTFFGVMYQKVHRNGHPNMSDF